MTRAEKTLLMGFLERLADEMSVAGCNDFEMEATPGNLAIAKAACGVVNMKNGKIHCMDFEILEEIRRCVEGLVVEPAR